MHASVVDEVHFANLSPVGGEDARNAFSNGVVPEVAEM